MYVQLASEIDEFVFCSPTNKRQLKYNAAEITFEVNHNYYFESTVAGKLNSTLCQFIQGKNAF